MLRLASDALEAPRYYARGLLRELMTKDIFLWAQAVAFKVLVSLVPLLLLATGVVGQVLRRDKPFEVVADFVRDMLPAYESQRILEFIQELAGAAPAVTFVGALTLVVAAVSLMTTLRAVVSSVFREDYHKARTILQGYLFDIRMAGQVGLFLLLTLALTIVIGWLDRASEEAFERFIFDAGPLQRLWHSLLHAALLVVPLVLSVGMFAQLYYFVPTPHPPLESVFHGALFAALLWELMKQGFAFYAINAGRFDVGTTFGLVLALVFWVYFSGLVLCLGALVTLLSEKRRRAEAQLPTRPPERPAPDPEPHRFAPPEAEEGPILPLHPPAAEPVAR
ncbi:MAG TPA: YhjD/YihY/BrkB family envelope integrity protein [Rhodothermales bacterium]|nr:YhjD/YihY/BrkB family envelope integrity protein [Rhodothermales bacterium]